MRRRTIHRLRSSLAAVGVAERARGRNGGSVRAALPSPVERGHPAHPLGPLIAEYSAIFGAGWGPVTIRKHRDDYNRFLDWLAAHDRAATTASFDFLTLVEYVTELRSRPKINGVWRGADAAGRSLTRGPAPTLSANSVNTYVRPLRSLAIWLVDEGLLDSNPFNRSRRHHARNPLLPSEETPTKSATLADIRALEAGCAGGDPLALRDRAIVWILVTTAARNSSVRCCASMTSTSSGG